MGIATKKKEGGLKGLSSAEESGRCFVVARKVIKENEHQRFVNVTNIEGIKKNGRQSATYGEK